MNTFPETFQGLLKDETHAFVYLATLMADGSPSVNPYRHLQLRGHVINITEEGADAHIDILAGKNTGIFKFKHQIPRVKQVIFNILRLRDDAHG
jgi:hypothetical protein